jgi:hypothetical protein
MDLTFRQPGGFADLRGSSPRQLLAGTSGTTGVARDRPSADASGVHRWRHASISLLLAER